MLQDLFTFALQNGLPEQTLVFLLLLPVLAILLVFFRIIIGLEPLPFAQGILLPLAFFWTGLRHGLFLFMILFILEFAVYTLLKRFALFPVARQAMSTMLASSAVLSFLLVGAYLSKASFISLEVLPILIIVITVQGFFQLHPGEHPLKPFFWVLGIGVYLTFAWYLLTMPALKEFALSSPAPFYLTLIIILLLLARFRGLRIVEFFRFFRVLSKSS